MSEAGVPRRQYTEEFKSEAVKLAGAVGQHESARRLSMPVATLGNGSRGRRRAPTGNVSDYEAKMNASARRAVSHLEAENSRSRKELASAKLNIEILRKATAYFANEERKVYVA